MDKYNKNDNNHKKQSSTNQTVVRLINYNYSRNLFFGALSSTLSPTHTMTSLTSERLKVDIWTTCIFVSQLLECFSRINLDLATKTNNSTQQ